MKIHIKRDLDKIRTAGIEIKLIDAVVNHRDYTELVNQIMSVDLNVFRIGRENKLKALYSWCLFRNEKGLKIIHPDADYNEVSGKIRQICQGVVKTRYRYAISDEDGRKAAFRQMSALGKPLCIRLVAMLRFADPVWVLELGDLINTDFYGAELNGYCSNVARVCRKSKLTIAPGDLKAILTGDYQRDEESGEWILKPYDMDDVIARTDGIVTRNMMLHQRAEIVRSAPELAECLDSIYDVMAKGIASGKPADMEEILQPYLSAAESMKTLGILFPEAKR